MIPAPEWLPNQISYIFRSLNLSDGQMIGAATRLANDQRMRAVWNELLRKDRRTGEYCRAAKPRSGPSPLTKEENQLFAIQDVIRFTLTAVRDERVVTRPEDIEQSRAHLNSKSDQLVILTNDLRLAIERGQLGIADAPARELAGEHLTALLHVADWLRNLALALRGPDDPMTVQRVRGNPLVKGVQITLASLCTELFGSRLDRTVATIASVAVGGNAKRGAARSALTRRSASLK